MQDYKIFSGEKNVFQKNCNIYLNNIPTEKKQEVLLSTNIMKKTLMKLFIEYNSGVNKSKFIIRDSSAAIN